MAMGIVALVTVCLAVAAAAPTDNTNATSSTSVITSTTTTSPTCDDIDTSACVLFEAQRPGFCADRTLAETACPRYCKLCPIQCYECNSTVTDFHMCTTTKLCARGEVCMRKQLNSIIDGHHEYMFSCEPKETCDGAELVIPFGKRSVEARDISISCCKTDRCNYPTGSTMGQTTVPTTVNGCKKDVLVLVDSSSSLAHDGSDIFTFLDKVFSKYAVGKDDILMSLATFAARSHKEWDFDDHMTNYELSHALGHVHLHGGSGDLNAGIDYAIHEVNHVGHHGNRKDAPDVVLVITDGGAQNIVKEHLMENKLHTTAHNVITIGIGPYVTDSELLGLATDSNHEFKVDHASNLSNIYNQIAQLICQA